MLMEVRSKQGAEEAGQGRWCYSEAGPGRKAHRASACALRAEETTTVFRHATNLEPCVPAQHGGWVPTASTASTDPPHAPSRAGSTPTCHLTCLMRTPVRNRVCNCTEQVSGSWAGFQLLPGRDGAQCRQPSLLRKQPCSPVPGSSPGN